MHSHPFIDVARYDLLYENYARVNRCMCDRVCATRLSDALYSRGHLTVCVRTIPEIDSGRRAAVQCMRMRRERKVTRLRTQLNNNRRTV